MSTRITITLDQVKLQTIMMGLSALQLQAKALEIELNAEVQKLIDAEKLIPSDPVL